MRFGLGRASRGRASGAAGGCREERVRDGETDSTAGSRGMRDGIGFEITQSDKYLYNEKVYLESNDGDWHW